MYMLTEGTCTCASIARNTYDNYAIMANAVSAENTLVELTFLQVVAYSVQM